MGVSGGYQAARHGPSMSPGCSDEAWAIVKPYLHKWAAKTHNVEEQGGKLVNGKSFSFS